MVYGIDNGAKAIIPVAQVEDCLTYSGKGYLLAAERNGEVVEGYDFGNSPFSYTAEKVAGKTVVLTTTNGTKALHLARKASKVVIGSFLNLTALCNWLNTQENNVLLLCAGWKDQFNLEDTIFAGAVLHNIRTQFTDFDDAGVAAEDLSLLAKDNLRAYIGKSAHSHRMLALNIEEDINFCLQVDICTAIPVLEGENLVAMTAAD